jgi:hypothetical protein
MKGNGTCDDLLSYPLFLCAGQQAEPQQLCNQEDDISGTGILSYL